VRSKPRNPLEPMATVVSALLGLTGAGIAVTVLAAVVGSGGIMGLGQSFVYVDVPGIVGGSDLQSGQWNLHDGVLANTTGYRFFTTHPDVRQRVWYTLTLLPSSVLFIGALLLVFRLVRGAERDGIYTAATARRLRTLGWFLLIGAVVKMVVEMAAANRLLATMVTNHVEWIGPIFWETPWAVLLTAAGLLTFARIMRIGVEMRDDLQGTV